MALINFGTSVADQQRARLERLQKINKLRLERTRAEAISLNDLPYDELSKLPACGWKNIYAPISSLDTSFAHDIPSHKFLNRDGELLEHTGRTAIITNVSFMFVNNIRLSEDELAKGIDTFNLYPNAFNSFLAQCLIGTTGIFVHPQLNELNCKLESFNTSINPNMRNGVFVNCVFKETIVDSEPDVSDNIAAIIESAKENAAAVDQELDDPDLPEIPEFEPDLLTQLENIVGFVNSIGDILPGIVGDINRIIYRCERMETILERSVEKNKSALQSLTALLKADMLFARNKAENKKPKLNRSTGDVNNNLSNSHFVNRKNQNTTNKLNTNSSLSNEDRTILFSINKRNISLTELANECHNTVEEFTNLNPDLAANVKIEPDTLFRFYVD